MLSLILFSLIAQVWAGALTIPGGDITFPSDLTQICKVAGTPKQDLNGFMKINNIPAIGALQSNVNATFYCNAQNTGYSTFDLDFIVSTDMTVMGQALPFAPTRITYRGNDTRLTAKVQYGGVILSLDANLQPAKLNEFKLAIMPGTNFADPDSFPFGKVFLQASAENSQTSSDIVGLLTGATVEGGYITYTSPNKLAFAIAIGPDLLPGFSASIEASMNLNSNGTGLGGKLTGSSFQLNYASLTLTEEQQGQVEPASFTLQVNDVGGVCRSGAGIQAKVVVPANADIGLISPIKASGNVSVKCTGDDLPKYRRIRRAANGVYAPNSIQGFKVDVKVDEFKLKLTDDDPITCSGALSFDSTEGTFSIEAKAGGTTVLMSQSLSNGSVAGNASRYDTTFELHAPGPIQFSDFPFTKSLLSGGVDSLTVANVVADFSIQNIQVGNAWIQNRTVALGAMANWTSGSSGSHVILDVRVAGNKADTTWSGKLGLFVDVAIGDYVDLQATLDVSKGAGPNGNLEVNTDIKGVIQNLDGLNSTIIGVAGKLNAIVPTTTIGNNSNLDTNKTTYSVELGITEPVALDLFGGASARLNDAKVTYNNVDGILGLSASMAAGTGNAGVTFGVQTEFNTIKSNTSRAIRFVKLAAEVGNNGIDLASLPVGLAGTVGSSGSGDLMPDGTTFKGGFSLEFSSESDNTLITDHLHVNASMITPWISGAVQVQMRRTLPAQVSLRTNGGTSWALEMARVDLMTEFANVTVEMDGPPCDPLSLIHFTGSGEFPLISRVDLAGNVSFTCATVQNKTTITGVSVDTTTAVQLDVFDTIIPVTADISYVKKGNDSAKWTFDVAITGGNGGSLRFVGLWNNKTDYELTVGAQDLSLADFPLWNKLKTEMPALASIAGSLSIKGANIALVNRWGKPSTMEISVSVAVDGNAADFDTTVAASFVKQNSTASWTRLSLNTSSTLYVADIDASIGLTTSSTCSPGITTTITGRFNGTFAGMPLGLPSSVIGDIFIPCVNGVTQFNNFSLAIPLGTVAIGDAVGLGSQFNLNNVYMNYSKPLSKFMIQTTVNPGLPVTLTAEMGYGVRSPVGAAVANGAQNKLGVRVWGALGDGTPMTLSQIVSAASGISGEAVSNPVARYRLRRAEVAAEESGILSTLENLQFANTIFDVDPSTKDINIRADITLYGAKAKIIFQLAKDLTTQKRVFSFGVAMKIPQDTSQMPKWLVDLVTFDGFNIEAMFIGVSTGAFTLTLPDDDGTKVPKFNCTTSDQKCLLQYSGAMAASVPTQIKFTSGGFGIYGKVAFKNTEKMQTLYQNTGGFGSALKSNSGSLAFAIAISPSGMNLNIGFDMTSQVTASDSKECTAGNKATRMIARHANAMKRGAVPTCQVGQSYSGLALQLAIDRTPKLSFAIVFTMSQQMGQDTLKFMGSVGFTIDKTGFSLDGAVAYSGRWNDPLGLTKAVTINTANVGLSLNIPALVPTRFALGFGGSISSRHGDLNVLGCVKVDVGSLGTGSNGMYLNATGVSLVPIVYGLVPDMPDSIKWMFEMITIDKVLIAVNPSTTALTIPECNNVVLQPGVLVDVTRFTLLKFFTVERARFEMITDLTNPKVNAYLELAPLGWGSLLSLTAFKNLEKGPSAYFNLSKTGTAFGFSAELHVLGLTAGAQVDASVDLITQNTNLDIQTTLNIWNIVQVDTALRGGGKDLKSIDFAMSFAMYFNKGPSLVSAAFDSIFGGVNRSLTEWAEGIKAERRRLDKIEEDKKNEAERKKNEEKQRLQNGKNQAAIDYNNKKAECDGYEKQRAWWDDYCDWGYCGEEKAWEDRKNYCQGQLSNLLSTYYSWKNQLDSLEPSWWEKAWNAAVDAWNEVVKLSEKILIWVAEKIAGMVNSISASLKDKSGSFLQIESIKVDGQLSSRDFNAEMTMSINQGPMETYKGLLSFNFLRMLEIIWGYVAAPVSDAIVNVMNAVGLDDYAGQVRALIAPVDSSLTLVRCSYTDKRNCQTWVNATGISNLDNSIYYNGYIFASKIGTAQMYRCSATKKSDCQLWNTLTDGGGKTISKMVRSGKWIYVGMEQDVMWHCDTEKKNGCDKWNFAGSKRYRAMVIAKNYLWVAIDSILWRCNLENSNGCTVRDTFNANIDGLTYDVAWDRLIVTRSSRMFSCVPFSTDQCQYMNDANSNMPYLVHTNGYVYASFNNDVWACRDQKNDGCGGYLGNHKYFSGTITSLESYGNDVLVGTQKGELSKCDTTKSTCYIVNTWYAKCVSSTSYDGSGYLWVTLQDC